MMVVTGEPMTVYKIMVLDHKKGLLSFFQDFPFKLGVEHKEMKFSNPLYQNSIYASGGVVDYGFHAFKNFDYALKEYNSYLYLFAEKMVKRAYVIVKCELPVGAIYYEGTSSFNKQTDPKHYDAEICTDEIKVVGWKYPDDPDWRCDENWVEQRYHCYRVFFQDRLSISTWESVCATSPMNAAEKIMSKYKDHPKPGFKVTSVWICSSDDYSCKLKF